MDCSEEAKEKRRQYYREHREEILEKSRKRYLAKWRAPEEIEDKMFGDLTFTFGYNSQPKEKQKDDAWYEGRCCSCCFFDSEHNTCVKYKMSTEPEQKCKAYKGA